MGFQRAKWHSDLTYQQTCNQCNTTIRYMDDRLDFRPWFADGFIYCPTCKKPLRHQETYAIDNPKPKFADLSKDSKQSSNKNCGFCHQCGRAFRENDVFCSSCGQKKIEFNKNT